jgi:crotonobetaine/carnitine-CoA ligase
MPYAVLEAGAEAPPATPVSYADPLAIFYTSGTTGPAKGVVLPQNYAWWHARQRIRLLQLSAADRWHTCLPLFHVNAHFITLVSSWVAGAEVVLGERFSASRFWDEIRQTGATGFDLIGSMPTMLLNQPAQARDGEHGVRLALAAPPAERFEEFERRFRVRCVQSFGMTEASPILMEPLDAGTRPSIGRAIAGHEARVVSSASLPFQGSIPAKPMKTSGCSRTARAIRSLETGGRPDVVESSVASRTAIIRRARYCSASSSMETGGMSRLK